MAAVGAVSSGTFTVFGRYSSCWACKSRSRQGLATPLACTSQRLSMHMAGIGLLMLLLLLLLPGQCCPAGGGGPPKTSCCHVSLLLLLVSRSLGAATSTAAAV
jgi:hypothetical protein